MKKKAFSQIATLLCAFAIIQTTIIHPRSQKIPCKIPNLGGIQPDEICEILNFLKTYKDLKDQNPVHNVYIIHGEPGVGKTTAAQALSSEENKTTLLYHEAGDLSDKAKVVGGEGVEKAFDEAEQKTNGGKKPVILVIDDIEAVGLKKEQPSPSETKSAAFLKLRSKLSQQLKNRMLITILVTNRYKEIDRSLLQRCQLISFKPLTNNDREDIFKFYAKSIKKKHHLNPDTLAKLAKKHSDFVGRDIKIVFGKAGALANADDCEHIQDDHLIEACEKMQHQIDQLKPTFMERVRNFFTGYFW